MMEDERKQKELQDRARFFRELRGLALVVTARAEARLLGLSRKLEEIERELRAPRSLE